MTGSGTAVAFFLTLALLLTPTRAEPFSPYCWAAMRAAGRVGLGAAHGTGHVLRAATWLPVVLPARLGWGLYQALRGRSSWAEVVGSLSRDRWHALAYGLLLAGHQLTGQTYHQLEKATPRFTEQKDDDIRVIVDILPDPDADAGETAGAGRAIYEAKRKGKGKVLYVRATDPFDAIEKLEAVSRREGLLTHVDVYFHGSAGRYWFADNAFVDFADGKVKPPSAAGLADGGHGSTAGENNPWLGKSLADLPRLNGMAAGGQVRWSGCLVLMAREGQQAMRQLSRAFLARRGGTYYAVRVATLGNPVELASHKLGLGAPPEALRAYGDLFRTLYAVPMINNNIQHRYVKYPDLDYSTSPGAGPFFFGLTEEHHIPAEGE